jgi:aerobic-type carbon monoxide dehydrogenase small subunit (CoxS/CutS family)
MSRYTLNVNGHPHAVDADPDTPLLWVLRDAANVTNDGAFDPATGERARC